MAEIELLIKIPEYIYKLSQTHGDIVYKYIAKGIPLPKGRGRLLILSENAVKREQVSLNYSCLKWISDVGLSNATVATIESEEEK